MAESSREKTNWLQQSYDKLLLILVLVGLLGSAVYLLLRITDERKKIVQGTWDIDVRQIPAEPVDLAPLREANEVYSNVFINSMVSSNLVMAPEVRVICVNIECQKPIGYHSMVCPFCNHSQPPLQRNDFDRDKDGMPDEWEEKYGLDKFNPNDAVIDIDGDAFTNVEEYQGGTDPTDIADVPPPASKLRYVRIQVEPFELVFMGVLDRDDGASFQLNAQSGKDRDRTYFKRIGEDISGWTLSEYLPEGPQGKPTLVLTNATDRLELPLDKMVRKPQRSAILISLIDGQRFEVKNNSEIVLTGFVYIVIDIQADTVIIRDPESGEDLRLNRLTRFELEALRRGRQRPRTGRGGDIPATSPTRKRSTGRPGVVNPMNP